MRMYVPLPRRPRRLPWWLMLSPPGGPEAAKSVRRAVERMEHMLNRTQLRLENATALDHLHADIRSLRRAAGMLEAPEEDDTVHAAAKIIRATRNDLASFERYEGLQDDDLRILALCRQSLTRALGEPVAAAAAAGVPAAGRGNGQENRGQGRE